MVRPWLRGVDVKVDGAAADGAAAGHGNTGDAGAAIERTEDQRAGTHGLTISYFGAWVG